MLGRAGRLLAAAVGAAAALLVAVPAAGQIDPDPIDCEADPTAAQCQDEQRPPGEGDRPPDGGGRACSFDGVPVPCRTSYGVWIGDVVNGDWYGLSGDVWPAMLVGCWATVTAADRDPPSTYHGEATSGAWHTLSCLGPVGSWPAPGPTEFGLAWSPDAAPAAPDAEELARRALASIDLRAPQLAVAPPSDGSVPLGMPVWLAVAETEATWGPISSEPVCEQGLCVEVTATAQRVEWGTGDGSRLACARGQNRPWRPGLSFLRPGDACHHFYEQPSRGEPGGSYTATATVMWRAEWEGGGQSGAFTGISEVCGADGSQPCASTVQITVEEIQVVGAR